MPETLVLCGGVTRSARDKGKLLELDVRPDADAAKSVDFRTDSVAAPLLDDLPDVISDALELAAYVYSADRLVRRGGSGAPKSIGSEWQREFRFRIPVRQPAVWQRPAVKLALIEVLSFLSGDRFEFVFEQATGPISIEPYLGFADSNAQVIRPDRVVLFSGGLDSLAGVARDVICSGSSAILVSHQSANTTISLQNKLAEAVAERTPPRRTFHAPIRVRRGREQPLEHSQRLRSFLFATLGIAYARMFGLKSVQFYENGITSFNLPVVEHVLGTRASRTTHPRVLAGYEKLFSALLDEPVTFTNPFLWNTKADIVRIIVEHGCADLIPLTTSCAAVRNLSMTGLQCGTCSQCVERRIAMAAAGLEHLERPYECDMFLGAIGDPQGITMVEGHLLRARRLATMTQQGFAARHGQAFRALSAVADEPRRAMQQIFALHQRYGAEFDQVVNQQLARHATVDGMRAIRHPSLLGMILPEPAQRAEYRDPAEKEPPASQQAAIQSANIGAIVLAVDESRKQISFTDGPVLTGRQYELLRLLVNHAREARTKGNAVASPFMLTRQLYTRMHTTDENLRRIVERARKKLRKTFEENTGYLLDTNDIIESDHWRGYRLNRHVAIVSPDEMPATRPVSRSPRDSVTELPPLH